LKHYVIASGDYITCTGNVLTYSVEALASNIILQYNNTVTTTQVGATMRICLCLEVHPEVQTFGKLGCH
jgi:hypothetical protein